MTETTKLPNAQQMLGIAKESLRAKDKATQLHTPIKDRKKTFYEVGNGNPKAMSLLESLLKIHGNNEIRALDTAAHCHQAIDIFLTEVREKGHVANLDDMAKEASENEEQSDGQNETDLNKQPTGEGGVPLGDAQKQLEGAKVIAENRRAARKALDLPEDGSAAAPPAAPAAAEKPKRGRKPKAAADAAPPPAPSVADKYVDEQNQRLGPVEAAPPPPPAPTLADDEEEDLRPEFMKRRERERAADKASVH